MAHYVFYVYAGRRGTGRAVRTVERDYWSDWLDLKREIEEAIMAAYFQYGIKQEECFVTVERVKYRPKRMAWYGYSMEPVSCRRERMAVFKVRYNPAAMRIEVKSAQLGGDFSPLIDEYYALERGIKWRMPPVIPKHKKTLKQIMMMEGGIPPNSYIPTVKPQYAFTDDPKYWEKRPSYALKPKTYYAQVL
ncbi:MAG: hypothetical protein QXR84_06135 [Candidatus Bathyarchaeia archaeon]